jgi:hypothetical protein
MNERMAVTVIYLIHKLLQHSLFLLIPLLNL